VKYRNDRVEEETGLLGRRNFLGGLLAATGTVAVGFGAVSCTNSNVKANRAVGTGAVRRKKIGLSLNGAVEYTKYVAEGVAKTFDGTAFDLDVVQANFDVQTELRNIDGLIARGVSGLIINPNTSQSALAGVKLAKDKGIPVGLAFWTQPGPLDPYVEGAAFVDCVSGGRKIGRWITSNVKAGKVIVVQGVLGQGFSEGLDQGLDEGLKGSGNQVVVRKQGFFDRKTAIDVVDNALQVHPDAATIVDYSSAMGNGISSYLKASNLRGITHITVAVDDEMTTWLGTPYLSATLYYSPAEAGVIAARTVRDALEGQKPAFKNPIFQQMAVKQDITRLISDQPYKYPSYADAAKVS
jgi:ABC-type sugar transport system substrate-binding protein